MGESTAYLRLKMDQLQTVTQSRMCCWKGLSEDFRGRTEASGRLGVIAGFMRGSRSHPG